MNKIYQELMKIRKKQKLLSFLILFFIIVIFWIAGSVFSSQHGDPIPPELRQLAEPLNPALSRETLNQLEQKKYFRPAELQNFEITVFVTDQKNRRSESIDTRTNPF